MQTMIPNQIQILAIEDMEFSHAIFGSVAGAWQRAFPNKALWRIVQAVVPTIKYYAVVDGDFLSFAPGLWRRQKSLNTTALRLQ
jgi:hypothetical protein